MKSVPALFLVASLVLTQSMAYGATGIYQTDYTYSFEGVALDRAHRLAFVVCDDNRRTAPHLRAVPKLPALSVRLGQDVLSREYGPQKGPAGKKGEFVPRGAVSVESKSQRTLQVSFLFALDSSTLSDTETAKLSAFVSSIEGERKDLSVSVEGYTCDLGSQAHNDVLAKKRAESVALYFERAGIRPTRVTGMGRCCYVTEEPGNRSLNRRVEITINRGETR